MKTKIIFMMTVAAMVVSSLTSCVSKEARLISNLERKYWHNEQKETPAQKKAFDEKFDEAPWIMTIHIDKIVGVNMGGVKRIAYVLTLPTEEELCIFNDVFPVRYSIDHGPVLMGESRTRRYVQFVISEGKVVRFRFRPYLPFDR